MNFGRAVGTACSSFAITNIDDLFVLVTFFAESSTNQSLSSLQIVAGQYVGLTVIILVSMIGYGASFLLPPKPVGFLGLVPLLLGIWQCLGGAFAYFAPGQAPTPNASGADESTATAARATARTWCKNIFKVSSVTVMSGADNIGTYMPIFSQAQGADIAVYVVAYYILLGAWCLAAFLLLKQKHVLRLIRKLANSIVPLLYLGLGTYIIVRSGCYPWSIEKIDSKKRPSHPGTVVMAVVTAGLLLVGIGVMLWIKLKRRYAQKASQTTQNTVGGESEDSQDPVSLELGLLDPQPQQDDQVTPATARESSEQMGPSPDEGERPSGPHESPALPQS